MLRHGNKDRKHKDLKTLSSKGETFMSGAIVILTPLEGGKLGWIEFNGVSAKFRNYSSQHVLQLNE